MNRVADVRDDLTFAKPISPTQTWNRILTVFYEHMPLKRHWRMLWPNDDTFAGREAVDFMLQTLPMLINDKKIVRMKCFKLLEKFMTKGLIFPVKTGGGNGTKFEDSRELYKFNESRIVEEINMTANSTFGDSSFSSSCILRRPFNSMDNLPEAYEQESSIRAFVRSTSMRVRRSSARNGWLFSSFSSSTTVSKSVYRCHQVRGVLDECFDTSAPSFSPSRSTLENSRKRTHPLYSKPLVPAKIPRM